MTRSLDGSFNGPGAGGCVMNRRTVLFLGGAAALLAACGATSQEPLVGTDGKPLPTVYKITPANEPQIPFRLLDSVNALRAGAAAACPPRRRRRRFTLRE